MKDMQEGIQVESEAEDIPTDGDTLEEKEGTTSLVRRQ
jgi:hypothetical protein